MTSRNLNWTDLIRAEAGLLSVAVVCGGIYSFASSWNIGFKLMLLFFLVPQPFILYSYRSLLCRRKRALKTRGDR